MKGSSRRGRLWRTLWNWVHSTLHNLRGVWAVVDLIAVRRLGPRLIPEDHPWSTGISPHTGRPIWPDNIVFASPRRLSPGRGPEDSQIVASLGRFLASMVRRSSAREDIPQGPKRRMPHAVNYIHGSVHYNGLFLVFDDLEDATRHFSDASFVAEFERVARCERRELSLVCRDRDYREVDLAFFLGFLRSAIPWYANANGPRRRVLYGGRCGFVAINTINGSWIRDVYRLAAGRLEGLVRPPVEPGRYFRDSYRGERASSSPIERLFAWLNYRVVRARGAQGGLVFTRRSRIEPASVSAHRRGQRIDNGTAWRMPSLLEVLRGGDPAEPSEREGEGA